MSLRWPVELEDPPGHRTCWVDRPVRPGDRVTLKNSDEPSRLWTVVWAGSPRDSSHIDPTWKVGGLS